MPEPPHSAGRPVPDPSPNAAEDAEVVDGEVLPVLAEPRPERPLARLLPRRLPAPAVAAAAGGFLAGVATFVLVRLLRRPRRPGPLRGRRLPGRRGRAPEIAASRSFLIDVHLLRR